MAECTGHLTTRDGSADDVSAAAEVLAQAFTAADYSWTRWTVAAEGHRDRLQALFRLDLGEIAVPHGDFDVAELDGHVVGAAAWISTDAPVPDETWARLAERQAPFVGDRAPYADEAEARLRPLRPPGSRMVLATAGVRPDVQGRGVGGALLRRGLERADSRGLGCYLETSSEDNVRFYGRYGFAVTTEVQLPAGPMVWIMARP